MTFKKGNYILVADCTYGTFDNMGRLAVVSLVPFTCVADMLLLRRGRHSHVL